MRKDSLMREALWNAHNHCCAYCGRGLYLKDVTKEHIIPKDIFKKELLDDLIESYGLADNFDPEGFENLLPACARCNSTKGSKPLMKGHERYYLSIANRKKEQVEEEYEKLKKKTKTIKSFPEPFAIKRKVTRGAEYLYPNHYWNSLFDVAINGHLPTKYEEWGSCLIDCRMNDGIITLNADDIHELIDMKKERPLKELLLRGELKLNDEDVIMVVIKNGTLYLLPEVFDQLHLLLSDFLDTYEDFYITEFISYLGLDGFRKKNDNYYILMETTRDKWKYLIDISREYDMDAKENEYSFYFSYNGSYICALNKEINAIVFNLVPDSVDVYHFKSFQYPDNEIQILWRIPSGQDRKHISEGKVFTLSQTYNWVCSMLDFVPEGQGNISIWRWLRKFLGKC